MPDVGAGLFPDDAGTTRTTSPTAMAHSAANTSASGMAGVAGDVCGIASGPKATSHARRSPLYAASS